MREIDGTRYMSASEYAELKNISKGRVSQIKATLPFKRFEDLGVELINVELLELQEGERKLMELQYSTRKPIHRYSYPQLGKFFAKLLGDLTAETEAARENASTLEEQRESIRTELHSTQQANQTLAVKIEELELHIADLEKLQQENAGAIKDLEAEKRRLEDLYHKENRDKEELLQKIMQLQDERVDHLTTIAELKGQLSVGEDLRSQVEALQHTVEGLVKKNKGEN